METTEIENIRISSLRIDTQDIVITIISVYRTQDNCLFEEKARFYDDVIVQIQRDHTRSHMFC